MSSSSRRFESKQDEIQMTRLNPLAACLLLSLTAYKTHLANDSSRTGSHDPRTRRHIERIMPIPSCPNDIDHPLPLLTLELPELDRDRVPPHDFGGRSDDLSGLIERGEGERGEEGGDLDFGNGERARGEVLEGQSCELGGERGRGGDERFEKRLEGLGREEVGVFHFEARCK
jgi:hypothetical protein